MTQIDPKARPDSPDVATSVPARRRGWLLGALGAGLATAVVITAVVSAVNDGDESTTADGSPSGPAAPPDDAVVQMHQGTFDPAGTNATMYYVGPENPNTGTVALFAEPHTVTSSSDVGAVHEFLTSYPLDPDYSSGWPEGVDVAEVLPTDGSGSATIALVGEASLSSASGLDKQAAETAIQGLIRTAGISEGVVRFTYNDEAVDRLLGLDLPAPGIAVLPDQSANFAVTTRAAIQVTSPVEGQALVDPVVITGNANVFEGNVNWQLLDASGREVDSGFVTAGFAEWADFEVDLGRLDAGTYSFRAIEFSAEDGSEINVDDKTFSVE